MTTEQNLSGLISAAVTAKMTPEFIEKEVNERVGKLVVESVDRALRSYSDTGKLIEKAVEDALRVERLDLPSYGETVLKILKAQIEARVAPLIAERLAVDMDELLKLAPAALKLSEIADEMREQHEGDGKYGEVITVIVEHNDYGSTWVYLDEDHHYEDNEKRSADFQLLIGKDGKISSATIRQQKLGDLTHLGRSYGLGQKIRAWFACGTIITLDEDAVCVSVGDY